MIKKIKRLVAVLIAFIITALSALPVSAGVEHIILHQPTTSEPFVTVTNAYNANYQWFIANLDYGEELTDKSDLIPVDGQTSSSLTSTPDGKKYVCEITWSDGVQKFSDVIINNYAITHQPTASEPYVTLNNSSGAVFQWYTSNCSSVTVTDTNGANTLAASTVYDGTCADGLWHGTPGSPVDIEFELKENQLLAVTPSAEFNGTVEEYGESFLSSQAGTYFYLAESNTDFNLCVENDTPFSAKVEVLTFTDSVPVDNQSDCALTVGADGKYYFCKIKGNGQNLTTPVFRYDFAFTHQPNATEPYAEINSSKNAVFNWFEVSDTTYKITDSASSENERELSNLWVGSFVDGKWKSNASGTFEGQLFIQKGQTLSIVLPDNFEGGVGGLQFTDGAYTYTAETNEKFYIYLKNPTVFSFEIYISEIKNIQEITDVSQNEFNLPIDGKTYRCSVSVDGKELWSEPFTNDYVITHQPSKNEPFVKTNDEHASDYKWYKVERKLFDVTDSVDSESAVIPSHIYKGSVSDGIWLSQNGKLDIELNLKKNDVILVELSDGYNGNVTVNESDLSFSGKYFTFIVPQNGLFNVLVSSANSLINFNASLKVMRGVKGALIGNTETEPDAISNGEYLCCVTFSDGTTTESDPILITDGALDVLEKELKLIAENATEDESQRIAQIAESANGLSPTDTDEKERIMAISACAANLLSVIMQKSNAVTTLAALVDEYDTDKLVPSDKNDLISIKDNISVLLSGTNLSQNQKEKLTAMLDRCDELIERINSLNITVSIINNPQKAEINYGQTITLSATATDIPKGAKIVWYVNDKIVAEGESFDFSPESNSVVTVKLLDENGNIILGKDAEETADTEQIIVKSNFFIKLINFFKKLFGISQTIVQTVS